MFSLSCLVLLAGLLVMLADEPGRDRLVWLLVGSVVGPRCAVLAPLTSSTSETAAGHVVAPPHWLVPAPSPADRTRAVS